jgi:outer membrane protein assembly factor BamA
MADGNAVGNGSVELRFPVLAAAGVFGAAFWDFGGLAEGWSDWHRNAVRHGVGAGVRYLIAGQIPVRLDYGIAVGSQCRDVVLDEVTGTYQCSQDEFGKLNLGVLYAF